MYKLRIHTFFLLATVFLFFASCKKETLYSYEVEDVNVGQPGANKPNIKSDIEFISIAYTDLFGTVIPPDKLEEMSMSYVSFGDKRLIIDMAILNLLNEPGVVIPTQSVMNADLDKFVNDCYRKFFVRDPGSFEKWFVKNEIQKDTAITPELVYYAFMTSNEYRYY